MEHDEVLAVYDARYAEDYNERFLRSEWAERSTEFEVAVLSRLLSAPDARWLDIGCGTGYFLSRFPEVDRAGLDLSPAMLEQARTANPDALFLRQGDFRDDVAEWRHAWSVVSCMWTAYNYVRSMSELDDLVARLVGWTRPGGSLFIPVMDLEDLRYVQVPYLAEPEVFGGTIALTGVTWSWDEPSEKHHHHLIAPHVDHFVHLLEPHFGCIDIVRYPLTAAGGVARKAVVATERRAEALPGAARVTYAPLPAGAHDASSAARHTPVADPVADFRTDLEVLRSQVTDLQNRLGMVLDRIAPPVAGAERYDVVGTIHEQVAEIRRELAALFPAAAGTAGDLSRRSPVRRAAGRVRRAIGRRLPGR